MKYIDPANTRKNIQLQVLVNSLASENQSMKNEVFEMKDRVKQLESKENEMDNMKDKMKTLEVLLTELYDKFTKLSSNED